MMTYDEADNAIRNINRQNLRIFSRLKSKLMKADELHIIRDVTSTYDESIALVERWFLRIAQLAYTQGRKDADNKGKQNPIDRGWLIDFLMMADETTLYKFLPEAERKKARLIEAAAAAQDKGHEVDKALKLWTRQIGWGAVSVVDAATIEAFEDAGVTKVKWVTKKDRWVCGECWDRDGVIYEIKNLPQKAHPGCRCRLVPVRN